MALAQTGVLSRVESLAHLPGQQKFGIVLAIAAIIALLAGAWMWEQSPDYKVLFSNLSDRDGGSIINSLQQMNVPYKFADGGGAILVPAGQVHEARLKLAAQGLPKGGLVGFELMENQKFGASQFQEQVNFQRALEGELARSIQSLSAVQGARVHLAMAKQSVFVRESQKPSASVLVNLHPGRSLDAQQVSAVVHLVASSVPELPVKNVTVVDQNGNLLTKNTDSESNTGLDPSQLKYVQDLEQSYVRRIEAILTPIVGPGNVRAQVTADVDFSNSEQTNETYKPNQTPANAAIRSQQASESTNGNGQGAGGIPGALTNQPPAPAQAPIVAPPGAGPAATPGSVASSTSRKDMTTNYEVDKTIKHVRMPVGGLNRLSVAVVVNNITQTDPKGAITTKPLSDAVKAQATDLQRGQQPLCGGRKGGSSRSADLETAGNCRTRQAVGQAIGYCCAGLVPRPGSASPDAETAGTAPSHSGRRIAAACRGRGSRIAAGTAGAAWRHRPGARLGTTDGQGQSEGRRRRRKELGVRK